MSKRGPEQISDASGQAPEDAAISAPVPPTSLRRTDDVGVYNPFTGQVGTGTRDAGGTGDNRGPTPTMTPTPVRPLSPAVPMVNPNTAAASMPATFGVLAALAQQKAAEEEAKKAAATAATPALPPAVTPAFDLAALAGQAAVAVAADDDDDEEKSEDGSSGDKESLGGSNVVVGTEDALSSDEEVEELEESVPVGIFNFTDCKGYSVMAKSQFMILASGFLQNATAE